MKRIDKIKLCPFFKKECIKNECAIYNENVKNCSIPVLGYNLYTVKGIISEAIDKLDEIGSSQQSDNPGSSSPGTSGNESTANSRKRSKSPLDKYYPDGRDF